MLQYDRLLSKGIFWQRGDTWFIIMDKSRIHEVPKNNGLIFYMGEVSELWRKAMVNNSHVFQFFNCLGKHMISSAIWIE